MQRFHTLRSVLKTETNEKKKRYRKASTCDARKACFTLLCTSVNRMIVSEARTFNKNLGECLATKRQEHQEKVRQ